MNNTPSNATTPYFDFITTGVAYFNDVEKVLPREGQNFDPFITATLAFLVTVKGKVEYRYVDCTIPATEAANLTTKFAAEANDKDHQVLAGVRISDLHSEMFTKRNGTTTCRLKARLIKIDWLKVDGKQVYKAIKKSD